MIRIRISEAAYAILAASCSDPMTPQKCAYGGYLIWLDPITVDQLKRIREPGEGFSETILRLAELEFTNP